MIKSDKGNIVVNGSAVTIRVDLACLFKSMRENTPMNVDEIVKEALKDSMYSEEELDEQIKELKRETKNGICNTLDLIRELIKSEKRGLTYETAKEIILFAEDFS